MGLATLDALLYQELAGELRERRVPTVSLLPDQRIPTYVAVVLTSPREAERMEHRKVLAVAPGNDRAALWAAVELALHPGDPGAEIVLGIDPGPTPGFAVLSEDRCLSEGILANPEAVAELARHLRHRLPTHSLRIRVGSGDRLSRDRILTALAPLHRVVEVVNEEGTTPRGHRRPRDAIAARAIARAGGRPVSVHLPALPTVTPGDIANLQRVSRERSGGQFTIPRAEAGRVLRGELTLSEALRQGEQRYFPRRPNPSAAARTVEH
ncbi:MAG: hypothetical protein L3J95_06420 [Thermoplasmata archaeon]|nr:hypothetical protein [Thermoplasmata archaeon]